MKTILILITAAALCLSNHVNAADAAPIKMLIVGGGSSHDFKRWFNEEDVKTLGKGRLCDVTYTDDVSSVLGRIKNLDVLYLSNNQPMKDPALRQALEDFLNAGKGLVLVHPALWYNWADWPEYNRNYCGGGSRMHNRYGEFEVKLTATKHPVTRDVDAAFKISDELYHFLADSKGAPITVLAEATDAEGGRTWPMVWAVKHEKARIACIALGHDGKAHEHAAYQTLLRNAVSWAAGR